MFERVIQVDPHRIEGIDAYSNILYVKEDFAKLAHLAHRISNTNKYTPSVLRHRKLLFVKATTRESGYVFPSRVTFKSRLFVGVDIIRARVYGDEKSKSSVEAIIAVDINPKDYQRVVWFRPNVRVDFHARVRCVLLPNGSKIATER